MKGIAFERIPVECRYEIENWFRDNYGAPIKEVWYIDYDFDLVNLVMADDIYLVFKLKFDLR